MKRANVESVAIVTGGASGIGRAVTRALTERGCLPFIFDIDTDGANRVVEELAKSDRKARAVTVDVRDREAVAAAVNDVIGETKQLDYMFNNAGVTAMGEALDYDWAAWKEVPTPFAVGYTAAKFGVVGLSQALRIEAERYGVHVSVVCPAAVETSLSTASACRHMEREKFIAAFPGKFENADRCAVEILNGVRKNRAVVTPGAAGAIATLHKLMPWATQLMMRRFARSAATVRDSYSSPPVEETRMRSGIVPRHGDEDAFSQASVG